MAKKATSKAKNLERAKAKGFNQESTEGRKAKLNEIVLSQLALPTENNHTRVGEFWEEFLSAKGIVADANFQPGRVIFKELVEYYALSRVGQLCDSPTVNSICTLWHTFVGYYNRATFSTLERSLVKDVYNYIRGPLKIEHNLSTKTRDKYLVTDRDLKRLTEHLWCFDDHDFIHERYRVQLSFLLIVFSATGARAGAIVESSGYRKSNQALTYRDIEVVLMRDEGQVEFQIVLTQRLTKGKRTLIDDNLILTFKSRESLQTNGVLFLFALAFADKAFKGFNNMDEILGARLPDDRDSWPIEWKDEVLDLPVFRMAEPTGPTSRALSYSALWNQVVPLGQRVGYRDSVRIHAIRGGVANKIKDPEIRTDVLGHANQAQHHKSYASQIISIDVQALYNNDKSGYSTTNVDLLRSMEHRRDKDAPITLPATEMLIFNQREDVVQLNARIREMTDQISASPSDHPELCKDRQSLYGEKRQLKRSVLASYREKWFSNSYTDEVARQMNSKFKAPSSNQRNTFRLVRCMLPARDRMANNILSKGGLRSKEGRQVLQDLINLSLDDGRVAYRPGERPLIGRCPFNNCNIVVQERLHPSQRSKHLHKCHQQQLRESVSQLPVSYSRQRRSRKLPFAEYCYACNQWITDERGWESHCQGHVMKPSIWCGLFTFRYTLVLAGLCPFCLSNEDLQPSRRYQQWLTKATLLNHIDAHLKKKSQWQKCPHPLCTAAFQDESQLRIHFEDVHFIGEPRSNCVSRKRTYKDISADSADSLDKGTDDLE